MEAFSDGVDFKLYCVIDFQAIEYYAATSRGNCFLASPKTRIPPGKRPTVTAISRIWGT
jgi:hypothetical protein